MASEELLISWVYEYWIYVVMELILTTFAPILSYIYMCGSVLGIQIRIHTALEYGSGSTTLPETLTVSIQYTVGVVEITQ